MPRLQALQAEWRLRPPAHWLLAAALNYSGPREAAKQASVADILAQVF